MKLSKYISSFVLAASAAMAFTSCSDEKFTETIFPETGDGLDPNAYTYKFDKWLKQEYLDVYNLEFRYKMQDVGTDMNYNLVPAEYDKAQDLAVLVKYLWFDAYKEVAGGEVFLQAYGPRIIHIIGSPAYNPQTGSMVLGLAEGGIKVSLFRVNSLDLTDFSQLNEYYFKTMHHEFAHILHQTKSIPQSFYTISTGRYDDNNWQDQVEGRMNSLGFVTTYASSQLREDFAETLANYVTKTDAQWARMMELAARGWESPAGNESAKPGDYYCFYFYPNNDASQSKSYLDESQIRKRDDGTYYYPGHYDTSGNDIEVYAVEDTDGVDGVAIINQKVSIVRQWLDEEWGIDLDKLREVVQRRQLNYNIEELRKAIDEIQ